MDYHPGALEDARHEAWIASPAGQSEQLQVAREYIADRTEWIAEVIAYAGEMANRRGIELAGNLRFTWQDFLTETLQEISYEDAKQHTDVLGA